MCAISVASFLLEKKSEGFCYSKEKCARGPGLALHETERGFAKHADAESAG